MQDQKHLGAERRGLSPVQVLADHSREADLRLLTGFSLDPSERQATGFNQPLTL
jgi:hypothetical protein